MAPFSMEGDMMKLNRKSVYDYNRELLRQASQEAMEERSGSMRTTLSAYK